MPFAADHPEHGAMHFADDADLFEFLAGQAPALMRGLGLAPATIDEALRDGMRLGVATLARMIAASINEGDYPAALACWQSAEAAAERWQMAGVVMGGSEFEARRN